MTFEELAAAANAADAIDEARRIIGAIANGRVQSVSVMLLDVGETVITEEILIEDASALEAVTAAVRAKLSDEIAKAFKTIAAAGIVIADDKKEAA